MGAETKILDISAYLKTVRSAYEADLKKLVDIPSVSMDPAHRSDIDRAAQVAADILRAQGARAEIIGTAGNPVVVGVFEAGPTLPTLAIYNHLDVQPADASEWQTPPFNMSIHDGVYRGRGTTDDKGPALAALYAARYANEHKLPLNIKFIWELEEEVGSPNFEAFLKSNQEKLRADSILISDTIWVSRERPSIPYGLRGLQGILVRLKTGNKDVHSGITGGLARNPIGELCQLISECYDARTGAVKIPGFYDNVRPVSQEEAADFLKSGFTIERFKEAHELHSLRTSEDKEGSQRIWARPTFEVHGITGGYQGPGVKTIVPHFAEAKISMRLVPDQDPEKVAALVTAFIKQHAPDAQIEQEGTLHPYLGEPGGPYAKAAAEAVKDAFGKDPAFTREGGSIGAVVSMDKILRVPIVFLGLSLPEHGYHAINENFDWQQAAGGMKMFVKYFQLVAQIKR